MIELSSRIMSLNLRRICLIDVLMIRWAMRSVVTMRHAFVQLMQILWRYSILIVDVNILDSLMRILVSLSTNFHSIIFLIASSIASFFETSSWIEIQCKWECLSLFVSFLTRIRSIYWLDCCLRKDSAWIAIWLSTNMIIERSSKYVFIIFRTKFSSISSFEYIV
jgi:hypothetical protein